MHSVEDQAEIINDLVYYGHFSYDAVVSMPVFERDFHHKQIIEKVKRDVELQAKLHNAKIK